jgi:hypothetical protein
MKQTKERLKARPAAKKRKTPARKGHLLDHGPVVPRPAFRAFALEDERYGRRRMRGLGKNLDTAKYAPNASHEVFSVYLAALGQTKFPQKWFICLDQSGKEISREKYVPPTQEQAARDLLAIAVDATALLSELLNRQPELCRSLAASKPEWPVILDLTEKDWQRTLGETVATLELGKDIKGYLLSARTADENVTRCWATAIYETLFQTRFDFNRALGEESRWMTTEGCPEWARKTLGLPVFIKANARRWAKLGEEMILQQRPDFLESPDLAAKKFSWTRRAEKDSRTGKASLRAIHREAFEDFAKELKNIAPEKVLWRGKW